MEEINGLFLQDRNWEICDSIKGRIEQFKRTMPLIQDLKNPAMRDRHWTQIKEHVQKPFDEQGTVAIPEISVYTIISVYNKYISI